MTEQTNNQPIIENTITPEENIQMADAIIHHQTIGELLRAKREEKNLSLKVISQQTKIHIGLLEHLENNDLDKLPSKTYVRGFVKSAAKILGINQETALDILESTYNRDRKVIKKEVPNIEMRSEVAKNTLSSVTTPLEEAVKTVTASSSAFLAKVGVILLIVGVIGFNVKNLIDKSAEDNIKLPKVLSTIHQKIKPAPKKVVAPKAAKTETEAAKANPIQVNIIQDKKEAAPKPELKVNNVKLKTISLGEKQFTEDTSVAKEKLDEIFPSRYRVHLAKGVQYVYVNAVDGDSWITYKVDDKEIKKYVLRQGRSVFMHGEAIRLFIGNTKSVKVFYNNKLLNLGSEATTKNVVFPEELKTKYMKPLFIFQKDGSVMTSDEGLKKNQQETPVPAKAQAAPAPVKKP